MIGEPHCDSFPTEDEVFKDLTGSSFCFSCHQDIACFTECCAKLQLILTPYDILRIKARLMISSDEFLDQYTETDLSGHHGRFPMVRLRMREDEKRTCPFVTEKGCRIYEDRPGACRLYPVGRAARLGDGQGEKTSGDRFFLVTESHCLGFKEQRQWNLEDWLNHEGVSDYNAMNDKWLEIIGSKKSLGPKEVVKRKFQMFFMASYNLDKFRTFLFQSNFFERFDLDQDIEESLKKDDVTLMEFAFDWLKFSLFGEKTINLR